MMFLEQTGVSDITVDGNNVRIEASNGQITITGAPADTAVKVVSVDGRQIASKVGNSSIPVAPGLYIVTVNDVTAKVNAY